MLRIFKRFIELLDTPAPEPGKILGWDENGRLVNLPMPGGGETVTRDSLGLGTGDSPRFKTILFEDLAGNVVKLVAQDGSVGTDDTVLP